MKRNVNLIGELDEERAWAAAMVLSGGTAWVSIDAIGDFLRMRQLEAVSQKFSTQELATRYALPPRATKWPKGWEDAILARALSKATDHKTLEHQRREDGNYFLAIPASAHDLWTYNNTATPARPTWKTLSAQPLELQ